MNALKTAPILAVLLLLFMAAPASAQVNVRGGVRVEIGVGGSTQSRTHTRHKARRGHERSSRRHERRHSRPAPGYYHRPPHVHVPARSIPRREHRHVVVHEHVVIHEHVQAPPPAQLIPMDDVQFYRLVTQIENEPFSEGKLRIISLAAEYNYFSSAQIYTVIASLPFSADKIEAAVLLYPMVVDPDAFYQVLSAFTFESSKEQVRARLGL